MTYNKTKKNSVISHQSSVISSAVLQQKGFSLVELIIYISIFAVTLAVGYQLLSVVIRIRNQTESRYEVQQNIRFAVEKISEQIKKASAISAPVTGIPANTLTLTVGANQVDFQIASGVLQMREGIASQWQNLTTDNVIASAPSGDYIFTKIDNSPAKSTVQIKLKIDYNDLSRPDFIYGTQMQTTVSLR